MLLGMLIASLVLSAILLTITNAVAFRGTRAGHVCAALIAGFVLVIGLFVLQVIALALNALLVCLAALACAAFAPKPYRFLKSSLAATAGCYGVLFAGAVWDVGEWVKCRDRYPFESLEERLAYEKQSDHPLFRGRQGAGPVHGDKDLLPRLETMEQKIESETSSSGLSRASQRTRSLQHLHTSYVKLFVDSDGFGAMRMLRRPSRYYLEPRDPGPIQLPEYSQSTAEDVLPDGVSLPSGACFDSKTNHADQRTLLQIHDDNVLDFAYLEGFGYFKDRRNVAGFESHRFHGYASFNTPDEWKLERLELVSLLKHEHPAVYVSEYLPRMKDTDDAKTRPLDAFERAALEALLTGEDLKVLQTQDHMRVLGSIRAAKQCLQCHSVERGDLLGAFTYRLAREKPERQP
jgi:hypothetical protein